MKKAPAKSDPTTEKMNTAIDDRSERDILAHLSPQFNCLRESLQPFEGGALKAGEDG